MRRWTLLLLLTACVPDGDRGSHLLRVDAEPGRPDAAVFADAAIADAFEADAVEEDAAVIEEPDAAIDVQDAETPDAIAIDGGWSCVASEHKHPNAGLIEGAGMGGCPAGMIAVAAAVPYCVDRFEASLVEVHDDGSTTDWSPYHHPGSARVRAQSVAVAVPQGYIDGVAAGRACEEAGKRLCTDTEWLRACRGPNDRLYPYGDARMNGVCNDARSRHPAVELFPDDPTPYDRIQDACINQLPDSLDRTSENSGCITEEGAFDMMGNLHEWTADPAGTFRGGFYVDTRINGEGCLYATTAHNTAHWDYSTGFRCCADL